MFDSYFYPRGEDNRPEPEVIREILIKMICAEPDNDSLIPTVTHLLRAYDHLLMMISEDTGDDIPEKMLDGEAAEAFFQKMYVKSYVQEYNRNAKASKYAHVIRRHTEDDREDILEGGECPEALGFWRDRSYYTLEIFPKSLVATVARSIAQHDAYTSVKMTEWYLKEYPEELAKAEAHVAKKKA